MVHETSCQLYREMGRPREALPVAILKDDTEVSVPTFLATKQKKGESIKAFVKRFRSMALQCSSGMTQSTLIETGHYNL